MLLIPAVAGRPPGPCAGLAAVGAAQCRGDCFLTLSVARLALLSPACRRPLSAGRRSQRRLHRAHYLRRLHHQRLHRQLHRPRAGDRATDADRLRFYHAMYQVLMFAMNLALIANNIGLMWVAIEIGDPDHRADGRHLPHPRGARGGVEILHSRQRRHRAGAVRHHPGLYGGPAGGRRRADAHGLDRR